MNFKKMSIFHRGGAEDDYEQEAQSSGGVLAVWGSPGSGKTVTAVKLAKALADKKRNVALVLCDIIRCGGQRGGSQRGQYLGLGGLQTGHNTAVGLEFRVIYQIDLHCSASIAA